MRAEIIIILLIFIGACNTDSSNNLNYTYKDSCQVDTINQRKDKKIYSSNSKIDTLNGIHIKRTNLDHESIISFRKKYGINIDKVDTSFVLNGKSANFYFQNPDIDIYSKEFLQGVSGIIDDPYTFAIWDSIFTINNETKPYYLFVFTKMMYIADGILGEGIGFYAYKFFESSPKDLIRFLNKQKENINQEKFIKEWASEISGEIKIAGEGNEIEMFDNLSEDVKTKCNDLSKIEAELLTKLIKEIRINLP